MSNIIDLLSNPAIKKRLNKIEKYIRKLEKIYPTVKFDFKTGYNYKSNGVIAYYSPSLNKIVFNIKYFNYCKFKVYKETVRHEVGHFLNSRINKSLNFQVHGKEWRVIMFKLGSINPRAKTDLSPSSVKFGHTVSCKCSKYRFSSNKITRMRKGSLYTCDKCNSLIKE